MTVIFCSMIIIMNTPIIHAKVFALAEGTVQSEDGEPIQGAKVILIFNEDGTKIELTTDKKGKWRKPNLRAGKWTVGFMAEGFEPQNITVELSAIRDNLPIEIRLSPIPESPFTMGDALYSQKKHEEALLEYQRVLKEHPDLYEAHDKIGLCYYRMDDYENAIEAFKLMLEKEPQSKDTLINLSAIYFEKGELEEGMKYFKQLDEKTLTDPGTFYNIGILFFKNDQIDMAVDYLNKCISLDPNSVDGHYQLGLANLNKGEIEEAKKNFEKVIELAPESERAALARKILENIN